MAPSTSFVTRARGYRASSARRRPGAPRWQRAAATFAIAFLIGVLSASAHADCFVDAQGSDDEPGQKDLTGFCLIGTCNVSDTSISWAFDDTNWNGNNTGDGCALFDTNGDGKVDRAVCVSIVSPAEMQSGNPKCYTCGNTRPDRCTSSVPVSCTSTCSVGSDVDPFAGDPSHTSNRCHGTNCRTQDTQTTCCLTAGDTVGVLIDVCSYPSQQPNSDPSDCVVDRTCSQTDPNDPICDDGNPCTVDSCDTTFGVCHHVAGNQGAQCRAAADVCDVAEVCDGTSIFCPADQFAQGGVCRNASDVCDVPETCDGTSASCPADGVKPQGTLCQASAGQCDVAEVCDGTSKACPADAFQPNNTPCNDNNACTTGDVCSGGLCVGSPKNCNDSNVCTDDSCNPSTGCVHTNNSNPCNDNNACTTNDACSGGMCVGGPPLDCNDNNVCKTDGCNPATGCTHTNNSNPCTDDDECTTNDTCSGGTCVGGPPPNCNDGGVCTTDSCVPPTGCKHDSVPGCCNVDADCVESPDDKCTTNERCVSNACVSDPVDCDDHNGCTDEECHPATGCVYTNNNDPCNDGSACTTNDACSGGSCVGGPPPNCNDNDVCTNDACNPNTGCTHTNNTAPCSDGSECTTNDHCQDDHCAGGPPPNCDDSNACTDDSCSPAFLGGCVHTNNMQPCDDGNGCTVGDVCSGGGCTSGAPKDCTDHEGCTDDSCSAPSGTCQHLNNANPCDDGDPCTVDDICAGGSCQPGGPLDCNDHLECTTDSCSPMTGCKHEPVGGPCCEQDADCLDSDECTINERCVNNGCVSDPRDCADTDPCTIDRCDNQGGGFLCIHDNCCNLPGDPCPSLPQCSCAACGNGVVEPGETCDPPDTTINPGTGQVMCRPDCTSCGDGVPQTVDGETCDDGNTVSGCDPAHPRLPLDDCKNNCTLPVCSDPAKILLAPLIDRFDVHGTLATDQVLDFAAKTWVVELTDMGGRVIFRRSLEAGAIHRNPAPGRFRFGDKNAAASGGIAKLRISRQPGTYRVTMRAFGNLFKSEADMVTHFFVQDQKWTVPCTWDKRAHGWSCRGKFTLQ